MSRLRVVADTNALISAALNPDGTPRNALNWIIRYGVLLASEATFDEFQSRFQNPKFDRYLKGGGRERYLALIREASSFVEVDEAVSASLDPADNMFLELALDGRADCIVSGDRRHLLPLHPFRGISILTPAEFMNSAVRSSS